MVMIAFKVIRQRNCEGHTLLELLIAMALSLFMMSGLIQAYLSSAKTFNLVQQQTMLQENARFALQFIETQVRRAGFIRNIDYAKLAGADILRKRIFPVLAGFDGTGAAFSDGAVVTGLDNTTVPGILPGSDVLDVRYQNSEVVTFKDCINNNLDGDTNRTVIITYFIDRENTLRCRGARNSAGRRPSAALVEGVDDMQVLFGVDDTNDGVADKYVTAADIATTASRDSEWTRVVSIKVALLVSDGVKPSGGSRARHQDFQLFGEQRDFSDGKYRAVFSRLITLRNRL